MRIALLAATALALSAHVAEGQQPPDRATNWRLCVNADRAGELIDGHPRGQARHLDVTDERRLDSAVRDADLVVSLRSGEIVEVAAGEAVHPRQLT